LSENFIFYLLEENLEFTIRFWIYREELQVTYEKITLLMVTETF